MRRKTENKKKVYTEEKIENERRKNKTNEKKKSKRRGLKNKKGEKIWRERAERGIKISGRGKNKNRTPK